MDLALPSQKNPKQQQQKQLGSSLSQSLWPQRCSTVTDSSGQAGVCHPKREEKGFGYREFGSNSSLTPGNGLEALGVP